MYSTNYKLKYVREDIIFYQDMIFLQLKYPICQILFISQILTV